MVKHACAGRGPVLRLRQSRRVGWFLVAGVLALGLLAPGAVADNGFPSGPPNDPDFPPGGQQPGECVTQPGQFWLYATIPGCYPAARDPEGAAGMSVDTAWRRYTVGDPRTVIAYVEAGVNWRLPDAVELADKTYLNIGELPLPRRADDDGCQRHDCNRDGAVSASDYAHDPRVHDINANRTTRRRRSCTPSTRAPR